MKCQILKINIFDRKMYGVFHISLTGVHTETFVVGCVSKKWRKSYLIEVCFEELEKKCYVKSLDFVIEKTATFQTILYQGGSCAARDHVKPGYMTRCKIKPSDTMFFFS